MKEKHVKIMMMLYLKLLNHFHIQQELDKDLSDKYMMNLQFRNFLKRFLYVVSFD